MPWRVPPSFDDGSLSPQWDSWIARSPALIEQYVDAWHLTPDGDLRHGAASLVLPVIDADGRPAMLKLAIPDRESAGEVPTLQHWRGRGAVRLLRADPRVRALLLERLGPEDLNDLDPVSACEEIAGLYGVLHTSAVPQIPDIRPLVAGWLMSVERWGRNLGVPPRFVEQALLAGRDLIANEPSAVIHGDLHYDNVLRASDGWQAIDPKGFIGDPCYEPAPLLWNRWPELGDEVGGALRDRFYTLVDNAGLDERRARDWVVVRSVINVAWLLDDAAAAHREPTAAEREWTTRMIVTAKAMQDVRP